MLENDKIRCALCGKDMPAERLECGYKLCILCNNEQPVVGFMSFDCKTNGSIQIIKNPKQNYEAIRQAERANRRAR
jgi:hypothetical protein